MTLIPVEPFPSSDDTGGYIEQEDRSRLALNSSRICYGRPWYQIFEYRTLGVADACER